MTLFGRRGGPMGLAAPVEPLSVTHAGVVAAAERLGVTLARAEPIR